MKQDKKMGGNDQGKKKPKIRFFQDRDANQTIEITTDHEPTFAEQTTTAQPNGEQQAENANPTAQEQPQIVVNIENGKKGDQPKVPKHIWKKINHLEAELAAKNKTIHKLENDIRVLNNDFKNEVLKKAQEAQSLLDQKVQEFQTKYTNELQTAKKYALKTHAKELLEIIHNLDLACNIQSSDPKITNFLSGFKMISKLFHNYLVNNGITTIAVQPNDLFDPKLMEAIETIPATAATPANHVFKVVKKGYLLHDLVLVPAMVVIATDNQNNSEESN